MCNLGHIGSMCFGRDCESSLFSLYDMLHISEFRQRLASLGLVLIATVLIEHLNYPSTHTHKNICVLFLRVT